MKRAATLTILAAVVLLAVADIAKAQQPKKIARIGYFFASTQAATARNSEAFRQGMRELGHVEGKTFVLELRYAEGRAERFPEIARELVSLKLDLIVAAKTEQQTARHETLSADRREYPDSPYANQAKTRLAELEKAR